MRSTYILILGLLIGFMSALLLSQRAVVGYKQNILISEALSLAIESSKSAEINDLERASDLVIAEIGVRIKKKREEVRQSEGWDLFFPVSDLLSRALLSEMKLNSGQDSDAVDLGFAYGRLGLILEKIGRLGCSNDAYASGSRLTGIDVARLKELSIKAMGEYSQEKMDKE